MKKKDLKGYREKSIDELVRLVREKKEAQIKMAASLASGGEKDNKILKRGRRDLAQLLTILREERIKIGAESKDKNQER